MARSVHGVFGAEAHHLAKIQAANTIATASGDSVLSFYSMPTMNHRFLARYCNTVMSGEGRIRSLNSALHPVTSAESDCLVQNGTIDLEAASPRISGRHADVSFFRHVLCWTPPADPSIRASMTLCGSAGKTVVTNQGPRPERSPQMNEEKKIEHAAHQREGLCEGRLRWNRPGNRIMMRRASSVPLADDQSLDYLRVVHRSLPNLGFMLRQDIRIS